MRIVSLLVAFLSLFGAYAHEGTKEGQQQKQQKIPTTLAEAHAELERVLSPQILAEIDALSSEGDMVRYHMSLGLTIRNRWGLWGDSPLAKYMRELGFTHPDDMSGAILGTFWRKRHGQDVNLEELRAAAKKAAAAAEKTRGEDEKRARAAKAAIANMMMGLHVKERAAPVVRIPQKGGVNTRFLSPFRGGVLLGAYGQGNSRRNNFPIGFPAQGEIAPIRARDDFYMLGFHFDLVERKLHLIRAAEIQEIRAAVVVGDRAWFAGWTSGKALLVGIGERDRITVDLPQTDEIPDLGTDGQSLLAVYSEKIFRLTGRQWTLIHSGDQLLPRSGLPPQLHANMVFLRDEGRMEGWKRLGG